MDQIKVSVIIPVYNVEKYIRQCVDSVLEQNISSMEVILVDDGSPDNCPQICDSYAALDARVKVVHKENGGVSKARNTGIKESAGEWLYFVDSDDWLVENSLKSLIETGDREKADVVFTDCYEQFDNGEHRRLKLFSNSFSTNDKTVINQVQESILCHKRSPYFSPNADSAYPAPWSKLIRASLVKENNIEFDPTVLGVYDDGLFTLEVLEQAAKIVYAGNCTYNYRILSSSIVHTFKKDMIERFEKNCFAIDRFEERNHKEQSFKYAEYARRVAYYSSMMSSYYFHQKNNQSFYNASKDIINATKRSPWKEAIQNARYDDLEMKHQYTLFCMRHGLIYGLKIYASAKRILKKH